MKGRNDPDQIGRNKYKKQINKLMLMVNKRYVLSKERRQYTYRMYQNNDHAMLWSTDTGMHARSG